MRVFSSGILAAAALLSTLSLTAQAKTWDCKAIRAVQCDGNSCAKEDENAVEITIATAHASLAMYSVIGEDPHPVLSQREGVLGFLVQAKAKTVSGEKLTLSAAGQIFADHHFLALIEGTQYEGTCQ